MPPVSTKKFLLEQIFRANLGSLFRAALIQIGTVAAGGLKALTFFNGSGSLGALIHIGKNNHASSGDVG